MLCVCGSAMCCVCHGASALHMVGTGYNSLSSCLSLSFNLEDSGVYCS